MLAAHSSSFSDSSAHLRVDGLSKSFGGRRVLTDISFVVSAGDRVGLIGENGSGKSTLLHIVAGRTAADAGGVRAVAPGGGVPRIGLLHQEPPFATSVSVAEALESAIAPVRDASDDIDRQARALAKAPDDAEAADAYARALDTAERLGAWEIDARVDAMLSGLGLDGVSRERATGALSGGQRARLSLAWLLLNAPDVLLLDEPTNHLDDQATDHLSRVLRAWRGPVLFASHDRDFLDETVTSLIDLDPAPQPHVAAVALVQDGTGTGIGVTRFTGGYTEYLASRAGARSRWEQQYRDEQAELSRLRAAVGDHQSVGHVDWKPRTEVRAAQKFYADRNAKVVSRRVNDARARLEDLERRQVRKPPAELRFAGLPGRHARTALGDPCGPVLAATGLGVTGRLSPVDLAVSHGEKWLVTGPNGVGKSTLLHVLAGRAEPTRGQVHTHPATRVGLLDQMVVLPDPYERGPDRTAREVYADGVGRARAEDVPLSAFGLLAGRDENRPVTRLSVGQQRRLALAILLADPPEILLLDEPTNHLSLVLVNALEDALVEYPGTVLIASHDRRLRRGWRGRHLDLGPK
ncbi:ABC-F family ATP-binding cassette domain-containing protein [Streptomyces tagetis]|uniref:ABC-F family ATP-binding cassette domain-containing protein n=1 Tax=Streptomyces tagetis TaxID=2820809 RepID=A0A940XH84_9ACTN|nr:ABC-F family ATP-binding cassette domain-containing protein [Streptomyces sp. RG38]MBQ0826506.1 ABC-F family ATP-binding cassette domain-containing protein [Streptomyces sp. RG38]